MKHERTWMGAWAMLGVLGLVGCGGAAAEPGEPVAPDPSEHETASVSVQALTPFPFPGATIWARQGVGLYDEERLDAVAQDRQGNTVAAGIFSGTIDFGAGPVFNGDPGDFFVVVVKYASDGRVLWNIPLHVLTFGIPQGEPFAQVNAAATDRQGNIVLAGKTASTFDLPGTSLPPGHFLLKLSPSGSLLWARSVPSTGTDARLAALATDGDSHVLLGG